MIRESTDAGVFEKAEYDIAARALRLDDWHLRALMTPRVDLEFLDLGEPLESQPGAHRRDSLRPLSRSTAATATRCWASSTRATCSARRSARARCEIDIEAELDAPLYVPESVSAIDLLEQLKKNHAELAMVVDEYGDIQGMITLTDVMTALVGEVPSMETRKRRTPCSARTAAG
jgi:putative hemolysin